MTVQSDHTQKSAPIYFKNLITVSGKILSVVSFVIVFCLFILDLILKKQHPYLEIFAYLVVPAFLVLGLLLIPVGAFITRARSRKKGLIPHFLTIDFNNPHHRRIAYLAWGVLAVFALFSIIGIYQAYHFTESNTFCGEICHTVMEPEYSAYHNSSHARVSCVDCHIGSGAKWYVRSKISGLRQVYSVLANAYSRPIETPIHDLRPSQETCERCHWPQKFFGSVEQDHHYFLPDENNTQWKTRMLVFVGGGTSPEKIKNNVHSHILGDRKIMYVATDTKRQVIPWVSLVGPDGEEKEVFIAKGSNLSPDSPPQDEQRTMDCMDCHNRPSHIFQSPSDAVNEALEHGLISAQIPSIKQKAVKALAGQYLTQNDAEKKIREVLKNDYQQNYPEVFSSRRDDLERAMTAIVEIYRNNFFPKMGVSWKAYPDNIGHMTSPGCFRCHDGNHVSPSGRVISNACAGCHAIISQGPPFAQETRVEGLEFKHPDQSVGEAWKSIPCYNCHTGE